MQVVNSYLHIVMLLKQNINGDFRQKDYFMWRPNPKPEKNTINVLIARVVLTCTLKAHFKANKINLFLWY